MASATAVTAVGAVVGVSSAGVAKSEAAPLDKASPSKLLEVPGLTQAQQVSTDISKQADAQTAAYDEAQQAQQQEAARQQAAAQQAAAQKAAADKAAAQKAAALKAQQQQSSSSGSSGSSSSSSTSTVSTTPGSIQALARSIIGNDTQFQCFSNIVSRESGWNPYAVNASSGAYGLVQALPGSKMSSVGSDWRTNPATQIKWGLQYMNSTYGSPCGAWSFWSTHHWY